MTLAPASGDSFTASPAANRRRDLIVIAVAGLLLYGLNVDFWLYGDSALYADFSLRRSFDEVSLHIGYYWLVVGAHAIGGVFGLPIQESMAWLNVMSGACLLCIAYLLALELLGDRKVALIAVTILALSGRMITNATSSEIYVTQTMFVLLSFLLFAREQIAWSAVAAACAMLVSPLSAFAFLYFPVLDWQRSGKVRWNVLLKLGAIALLCYTPYLIAHGYDLLWGRRGLLSISGNTQVDLATTARNFPKYQFKQYTALLALIPAAFLAYRKHQHFFQLAIAVALPHLYVIAKLPAEDNVFIFNTDFFSAALLALGWREFSRRKPVAWVGPALLAAHVALMLASKLLFNFNHHRNYPQELRAVNDGYMRGKDATIITDWGTAVAFTFHARDSAATGLLEEPLFKRLYDLEYHEPDSIAPLLKAKELYVLDRWNPTPFNRLFRTRKSLEAQFRENALKNVAERRFGLSCDLIREETNRFYKCRHVAPVQGVP